MILDVAITQLKIHEVFVRLAQQLVEVEEGQLRTVAHQPRDRLVNAAHCLLRDRRVAMARRLVVTMTVMQQGNMSDFEGRRSNLDEMWRHDRPTLHELQQRSLTPHHAQHDVTQSVEQQRVAQ